MKDKTNAELKTILEDVAQEITNRMPDNSKPILANFPRGFIRPLNTVKPRWSYLEQGRRRTVACMIQLCDVNRWNLNTWRISLTAGSVFEWHATLPVIAVIEALVIEFGLQHRFIINKKTKFKAAITSFWRNGVISETFRDELHQIRRFRNEIHLRTKSTVNMYDGKPKNYNKTVKALHKLERCIQRWLRD